MGTRRHQARYVRAAQEELSRHYTCTQGKAFKCHMEQLFALEGRPAGEVHDRLGAECSQSAARHINKQMLRIERDNKAYDRIYGKFVASMPSLAATTTLIEPDGLSLE